MSREYDATCVVCQVALDDEEVVWDGETQQYYCQPCADENGVD